MNIHSHTGGQNIAVIILNSQDQDICVLVQVPLMPQGHVQSVGRAGLQDMVYSVQIAQRGVHEATKTDSEATAGYLTTVTALPIGFLNCYAKNLVTQVGAIEDVAVIK